MTHYWIFKTDNKSNRTISICNGSHNTEAECRAHWVAYLYGFMDSATELLGGLTFGMDKGAHELSFRLTNKDKDFEYFMLLDDEGRDYHYELAKAGNQISINE